MGGIIMGGIIISSIAGQSCHDAKLPMSRSRSDPPVWPKCPACAALSGWHARTAMSRSGWHACAAMSSWHARASWGDEHPKLVRT